MPALAAELLDDEGAPVAVSGRGEASAAPARLLCAALPGGGGPVHAWAGPWLARRALVGPRHAPSARALARGGG